MAAIKIKAKGGGQTHELRRWERTLQQAGDPPYKSVIVLTSDGRLLRKGEGGYSVQARIKDAAARSPLTLIDIGERYASGRGHRRA